MSKTENSGLLEAARKALRVYRMVFRNAGDRDISEFQDLDHEIARAESVRPKESAPAAKPAQRFPVRTPQGRLDTTGCVFLVVWQFESTGQRFDKREAAEFYANTIAADRVGRHVEIFECVENRYVSAPVVVANGQPPEATGSAA